MAHADLRQAQLTDADLTEAVLYMARLEATDLSGTKGLTQHQLDEACGDAATVLPDGLAAPSGWPCALPPEDEEEEVE
jgi:uncharacterized protein YjbI with pentapeptide repeats